MLYKIIFLINLITPDTQKIYIEKFICIKKANKKKFIIKVENYTIKNYVGIRKSWLCGSTIPNEKKKKTE